MKLYALEILLLQALCELGKVVLSVKCPGKCINDPHRCHKIGGKILGYCTNEKICCDDKSLVSGSCGSVLHSPRIAYFRSPKYPHPSRGDKVCDFTLQFNADTIGVRIDFLDIKMDTLPLDINGLAFSQTPICGSDWLFLKGFDGWSPDPRCGNFTGHSVLVEREEDLKNLQLVFVMSSSSYWWNIKLTLISDKEVKEMRVFNNPTLGHESNETEPDDDSKPSPTTPLSFPPDTKPSRHAKFNPSPIDVFPQIVPHHPYFQQRIPAYQGHPLGLKPKLQATASSFSPLNQPNLSPMSRIAGGEKVAEHSIPWQVSVQTKSQFNSGLCGLPRNMSVHVCGGTIIDEKTILSAAHCFFSPARFPHPIAALDEMKVVVGDLDFCIQDEVPFTKEYSISKIIFHFNYLSKEILNDVAIIRLNVPIEFNHGVRPVPLADTEFEVASKSILLSGWGSVNLDGNLSFPSTLQQTTDLILLPEEECRRRQIEYLKYNLDESELPKKYAGIYDKGYCVRGKRKKVEAGFGDSGGPLVAYGKDKDEPTLIGVVSHMRPEVEDGSDKSFNLDYFVKVSAFKKWILMGMVD